MKRRLTHCAVMLAMLCAPARDTVAQSIPSDLPSLRLVLVNRSSTEETSPATRFDRVDVNAKGLTIMRRLARSGGQVVVVDSTGRLVVEGGPTGSGPGELRNPALVRITEGGFSVFDVGTMRITTWAMDGRLQKSNAVNQLSFPILLLDDEMLAYKPMASGPLVNFGRISSGAAGTFESIATSAEPPLSTWFPRGMRPLPAAGLQRDGFVLGDPIGFNFVFLDRSGRLIRKIELNLPQQKTSAERVERQISAMLAARLTTPARAELLRKNLLALPVPHFHNQSPLRVDDVGRIWALGMEGDSAVAHVVSPAGTVIRIPIACPGFEGYWSMSSDWLAVVCAPADDNSDLAAVRLLYRIQQGPAGITKPRRKETRP